MAKVIAIARKSFYLGKEVKTRQSKPFEVDEHHFNELKHNGLVARAPEKATEADAKAAAEAEAKEKEEADAKAAAEAEAKEKEEADAKAAAAAAKKAKA